MAGRLHFTSKKSIYGDLWSLFKSKKTMMFIRPDPNEELRLLEEKAAATYGVYKEKCDTKVGLLSCLDSYTYSFVALCG